MLIVQSGEDESDESRKGCCVVHQRFSEEAPEDCDTQIDSSLTKHLAADIDSWISLLQLEAGDEPTRAKIDSGVFYSSQAAACLAVAMEMETDDPLTLGLLFFYFFFVVSKGFGLAHILYASPFTVTTAPQSLAKTQRRRTLNMVELLATFQVPDSPLCYNCTIVPV